MTCIAKGYFSNCSCSVMRLHLTGFALWATSAPLPAEWCKYCEVPLFTLSAPPSLCRLAALCLLAARLCSLSCTLAASPLW